MVVVLKGYGRDVVDVRLFETFENNDGAEPYEMACAARRSGSGTEWDCEAEFWPTAHYTLRAYGRSGGEASAFLYGKQARDRMPGPPAGVCTQITPST